MIIRIPGQVWHWVLTSPLVKPARRGDGGEWIPRWNLIFVNEVNLVEISFSRPLNADDTNKNLRDGENEVKIWKQDILIYQLFFDNNPVVHLFAVKTENEQISLLSLHLSPAEWCQPNFVAKQVCGEGEEGRAGCWLLCQERGTSDEISSPSRLLHLESWWLRTKVNNNWTRVW